MKVLVLEQTNELAELLGIYLSALSSAQVQATHLTQEAMTFVDEGGQSVFLCHVSFSAPGSDLALKTWREKNPGAPVIFLGDGEASGDVKGELKISHLHLVQELKDTVKSPLWRKLEGKPVERPLPLSPYLIYRLGICPADLFLKLGEDNWVKLFHKGAPFGQQERTKFEAKALQEFWVLPEDIGNALGHFEDLLGSLTGALDGNEALVSDVTEFIWHLMSESGFREEVQQVVKAAMHQALAVTKKNPSLNDYMEKTFRPEHEHLVRHSMIATHIACAIANELGWTSEQTYLKLTVAALMHDMLLPNMKDPEDMWVTAIGNERTSVSNPDFKTFLQHPTEGAQLLRRFRDIPPDTDKIVLEHHELPEGTGFPRGLTSSQISPLGCLFILAHESAEVLLRLKEDRKVWTRENLLSGMNAERWQSGNFKKIWQSLEKVDLFEGA